MGCYCCKQGLRINDSSCGTDAAAAAVVVAAVIQKGREAGAVVDHLARREQGITKVIHSARARQLHV